MKSKFNLKQYYITTRKIIFRIIILSFLLWNYVNIGLKLKEQASTGSAKDILNVYNTTQENTTNSSLEILNVYNTIQENTFNSSLEIHNTTNSSLKILN
ncbi:43834_t:CDS:2, partial [Gigaspora margarita]